MAFGWFRQPPRWYSPFALPRMTCGELAAYDRAMARYVADTLNDDEWDVVAVLRLRVEVNVLGGPHDGAGESGGQAGWTATTGR